MFANVDFPLLKTKNIADVNSKRVAFFGLKNIEKERITSVDLNLLKTKKIADINSNRIADF